QVSRNGSAGSAGKRISFDFTNQGFVPDHFLDDEADIYHSRRFNGLPAIRSAPDLHRVDNARRPSQDTLESAAESDISISKTVAAHVRRDSIALFSDRVNRSPLNRATNKLAADLEHLRQAHGDDFYYGMRFVGEFPPLGYTSDLK
ncbi:hypothetical protein BaRGS_00015174, partial [Batillaria attramentaria]